MSRGPRHPQAPAQVKVEATFDPVLLIALAAIVALGVVMVTSASMALATRNHGEAFFYIKRHLFALLIGGAVGALCYRLGLDRIRAYSVWGLFGALLLLVLVLVPGLGHRVNGAWRWLSIGGLTVQASELAKLAIIVYLAGYLVRHQDEVRTRLRGFLKPVALLVLLAALLLMEPDLGTTIVLTATALGMILLAGAPIPTFIAVGMMSGCAVGALIWLEPYRLARMLSFRDPWPHVGSTGYQLAQSLIAFGRGEWFGVGLGNGVQKLFYLPEVHTDFIFAVIGEELGLVGTVAVIGLFLLLVWRIFRVGARAERRGHPYAANLTYGIALLVGLEAFINIGVNMGFLPTKGLTLPFISYGNNSTIVMCVAIALVLRAAEESAPSSRRSQEAVDAPAPETPEVAHA